MMIPLVNVLNATSLFVVAKYQALHEPRFVVLGLLAMTDFLSGLISQPLFIAKELLHLLKNDVDCSTDTAYYLSTILLTSTSFYQLTYLTYDRYVAVTNPYHYSSRITIRRLVYATLINFVFNTTIAIIYGTSLTLKLNIFLIGGPGFLLCCIAYWYIVIFKAIRKQNQHMKSQQAHISAENHESDLKKYLANRKLAINAVCIVAFFEISYIPVIIGIVFVFWKGAALRSPLYFAVHPWVNLSVHSSALFSPLLYGLRTNEFRKYFKLVFGVREEIVPTFSRQHPTSANNGNQPPSNNRDNNVQNMTVVASEQSDRNDEESCPDAENQMKIQHSESRTE